MRLVLVILFLLLANDSWAKDHFNSQQTRNIEVSGVGIVNSVPDRFSFTVSVEQKGKVATELNKAIVEKTNAIVQALFKIGVDKKAVQSLQVQFNPWIEYNGKNREQKGFVLTRQITVTVKNLNQYQESIDAVLNMGVNNIGQFNFTNSQADENYQEALKQALINAKHRAIDMVSVLGLKLGKVVSISEQSSGQVMPMAFKTRQLQASESYQPGEMSTQATVKVVFEIKDAP